MQKVRRSGNQWTRINGRTLLFEVAGDLLGRISQQRGPARFALEVRFIDIFSNHAMAILWNGYQK